MEAVILDRDGVINHDSDAYIKSPEEWRAIDGSLEAIAKLTHANIKVYIASNQSGIAYGFFDYDTLHAMHRKLLHQAESLGGKIDGFFFCPYLTGPCRKPNPGMLFDIAARTHIRLETTPFIGDTLKDVHAAMAANAIPILVRTGKGELTIASKKLPSAIPIYRDLHEAVEAILVKREK